MELAQNADLVFRNQNQAAQQGSERARQEIRRKRPEVIPLRLAASSSASTLLHAPASLASEVPDTQPHEHYRGLRDREIAVLPQPIARDPGTRAVERFFIDWTSLSRHDGVAAGHEHDVPNLYSNANPDSILWFAARAMAFAHVNRRGLIKDSSSALHLYGEALAGLRSLTFDGYAFANDDVLAGLLLVDAFEVSSSFFISHLLGCAWAKSANS